MLDIELIILKFSILSSNSAISVTHERTPECPPKGMFQTPGPYVRMNFLPPTPLCLDFGTEIRFRPMSVRIVAHTYKKNQKISPISQNAAEKSHIGHN
jgi:hypothetical protein